MKFTCKVITTLGVLSGLAAQTPDENSARMAAGATPIYRVSVTARTAKAINYRHRSGATKIDFRGTDLLPKARGEAKVESKQGYIEVEVEFDDLQAASKLGSEWRAAPLTWARSSSMAPKANSTPPPNCRCLRSS